MGFLTCRYDLLLTSMIALAAACGSATTPVRVADSKPVSQPVATAQVEFVALVDRAAASLGEALLPGATVALARGGKIVAVHAVGLADLEQRVPATAHTVYCIGSISKTFAAAAVLQLVEDERVALDDDITEYLPDFPTQGQRITIHHLLHHESGLQDFEYRGSWPNTKAVARSKAEVVATFSELALEFTPGSEWRYSTSGYYLLGLVIEKVSGKPYEDYMREQVFAPAGLTSTSMCDAAAIIPHRARGYTSAADGQSPSNAELADLAQFGLGGGICSTATDLLRFWNALASGKIVSPASFALMQTAMALADGTPTHYGYGLFRSSFRDVQVIGHSGGVPGFTAQLLHYPAAKITIAVLGNSDGIGVLDLEHRVARELAGFAPIRKLAVPAAVRDRAVGCYGTSGSSFEVLAQAEQLFRLGRDGKRRALSHQGQGVFLGDEEIIQLTLTGPTDRATGVVVTFYGMAMAYPRVPCQPAPG